MPLADEEFWNCEGSLSGEAVSPLDLVPVFFGTGHLRPSGGAYETCTFHGVFPSPVVAPFQGAASRRS